MPKFGDVFIDFWLEDNIFFSPFEIEVMFLIDLDLDLGFKSP
jgi:hypothetical protein